MLKYLILCLSLMLALPSYAALIVDGGVLRGQACAENIFNIVALPYRDRTNSGGRMLFMVGTGNMGGLKLSGGVDNPSFMEFDLAGGSEFKCSGDNEILGFTYAGLNRLPRVDIDQKVTVEVNLPAVGDGYFEIGNGLAMKLFVKDLYVKDHGVISINQAVIPGAALQVFYAENEEKKNKVGPTFTARLKVVGEVTPGTDIVEKEVARIIYRTTRTSGPYEDKYEEVNMPLVFTIIVDQASLRTCTLDSEHRDFSLIAVAKPDLDAGRELQGGQITLGPVTCPAGVDVKASFYDHNSTGGLKDYLRTVYTDDESVKSQYAFKFFDTAGGPALKFLPIAQWNAGYDSTVVSDGVGVGVGVGVAANDTTVDFSDGTTTVEGSIEKNFIVKYVKTVEDGEDHAGAIKGLMTVQFLYY